MPNRNETIAETLRALSSTPEFKEAGFSFEILDDLITRCEKLPKDDPNKIRKRSATRASKELTEGPKRIKGGYGIIDMSFKNDDGLDVPLYPDLKQQIDDLAQTEDPETGKKMRYMTAKSRVWKGLSEELKNELTLAAETKNKENGHDSPKTEKTSSPKTPNLTKAQLEEQLKRTQQELKDKAGLTDDQLPAAPEREPPKPRKSKKDKNEEQDSNSDTKSEKSLTEMVKSIQIGDDSDSDDDDEPQEHNQILWAINIVKSDTSLKEEMKDFHAWIMATQPDTFGPDKPRQAAFTKDEIKPLKKTHNFKELKNDPSAPWFEFITNNA